MARGKAKQMFKQAIAYKVKLINGRVKLLGLHSYSMNTKKLRSYKRETIFITESVLSNSSKVMIDVEGGNNMMHLLIDQS